MDYAGGVVVRLPDRQGHQTLHHSHPRDREQHGQRNDQSAG
jgi:hypothetical protein